MKKRSKKLISILLSIVMLIGMVPAMALPALAESPAKTYTVGTYDELQAALSKAREAKFIGAEIIVTSSIALPADTTLDGGVPVRVFGNLRTVTSFITIRVAQPFLRASGVDATSPTSGGVFTVADGNVTLKNMVIMGGKDSYAVAQTGGVLTLDTVSITRSNGGLSVAGGTAILKDSSVGRNKIEDAISSHPAGGGIKASNNATVILDRTSVSENRVMTGAGGGVEVADGAKLYANNSTFINNAAGGIGGGIDVNGGEAYLMNCTLSGNVISRTSENESVDTSKRAGGGVGLRKGGKLYGANTLFLNNYLQHSNTFHISDVGMWGDMANTLSLANCGYNTIVDGGQATTLTDCKAVGTEGEAVSNHGIKTTIPVGGHIRPAAPKRNEVLLQFYAAFVEDLYVPLTKADGYEDLRTDSHALTGGVDTYFDYSPDGTNVRMSYGENGETSLIPGGTPATTKVTETFERYSDNPYTETPDVTPRAPGVIGASNAGATGRVPFTTSDETYQVPIITILYKERVDNPNAEHLHVIDATQYGDSYMRFTEKDLRYTLDAGYELTDPASTQSMGDNTISKDVAAGEQTTAPYTPTNPLRYFSAEAMSNEYFTRPAVGEAQPVTVELWRSLNWSTPVQYDTISGQYSGSLYTLPDAPAIEGYEFWYWRDQNGTPQIDENEKPIAHPTVQLTSGTNKFTAMYRVYVPSYDITFKWNIPGIQTEDVVKTCRANEVVPPDSSLQPRPGYRIKYWSTNQNDEGQDNVRVDPQGYIFDSYYEQYQANGPTTFYAQWAEDTIRVLYVPSGSEGETGSPWYNDVRRGEQYQFSENQFKREGYVLDYWQGYIDGVGSVKFSDRQTADTSGWGSVIGVQLYPVWKVLPRPTVPALTYNGNDQPLATTPEGETILYGSSENGPWSETPPTGKDAGEHKFWYKSGGADPMELTVTIAPKEVSVTGLKAVKVYDGTTTGATLDATGAVFNGKIEGDELGITCDAANIKGYNYDIAYVGTGKGAEFTNPTLTGADAKNYRLKSATGTGEITKRPITIKALDQTVEVGSFDAASGLKLDNSTTYESTDAAKGAAAENLPQGFFLKRLKLRAEGNDKKGEGKVFVSSVAVFEGEYYDASSFFEISYEPGTLTVIGTRPVLDELSTTGITYGQTLTDSNLTGKMKDKDGNEVSGTFEWKLKTTMPSVSDSNYTPYVVEFTPEDTTKYDPVELTTTVQVEPKEIEVEWSNTEFTYDGNSHKPTATAKGLLNGDECAVIVSGEQVNAGEGYIATAESLDNPNYKLPETKPTTTFKIAKANVGGITPPTDKELTYDGADQELIEPGSVSEGGRMLYSLSEDGPYSETIPTGKNAENYTVYYKVKGDDNHNDTEPASIKVTIQPKEVKLVWENTHFVYDGEAHKPTARAEGLVGADTLDITVNGAKTNAGNNYTAEASIPENGNYKLPAEKTTEFEIAKRSVTVTANAQSVGIGGTVAAGVENASLAGALEGHALSDIDFTASDLTHANSNATITPKNAKIKAGNTDVTANYEINYVDGKLTVLGNVAFVKQNSDGTWPAQPTVAAGNSALRTGTGTSYSISAKDVSRFDSDHYHLAGYGTAYSTDEANHSTTTVGSVINLGEGVDTLYLYYAVNTYDLVFYDDAEGKIENSVNHVRYGETLINYADTVPTTQNGYRFAGWTTTPNLHISTLKNKDGTYNATLFDFDGTMPDKETKLYPIWIHDRLNVHLDLGAYDTVYHSEAYTSTHDWYATSQNGKDEKTPATMAADQSRDFTVDIGEKIRENNLMAATRVGYELDGWYTKGGLKWSENWDRGMDPAYTDDGVKKSNDERVYDYYTVTLTAHWTPKSIPVVYDLGDHAKTGATPLENGSVALEGSTQLAAAPEAADGYAFIGWQDKSGKLHSAGETFEFNDWDLTDAPTEQITLTAVYEQLAQIDVYFDTDGGTAVSPITGHSNQMLTMSNYQTKKTGHTFDGWYLNNTKVDDTYTLEAQENTSITFKAHWRINQYTITFDTMGGNEIAPIKQNYDTGIVAPTDPTRTGYTFQGWSPALPAKMPAHDLTVQAIWQLNKHTLTLNRGDETEPVAQEKDYGSAVTVEAPTREGYTFQYWKNAKGEKVVFPFDMPDEDVTITAFWKQNQDKPEVEAEAPDANTVKVTDPQNDVEYIIIPKNQTPKAEDWTHAKKIENGEVKWNDRLPATEYDVYARRFETENKMPSEAVKTTVTTPKADQAAPNAPPAKAKDPTTVIVEPTDENEEYIIVPKGEPIPENPEWKSPDANGKVEWTDKKPNTEYDVYARLKGTDTQNPSMPSPATTVRTPKMPNRVTPPTAEPLTYNRQNQKLLKTLPTVEEGHGTIQYSLDGENWTEEEPTGKNAGKYTVWYKVIGNETYEDVAPATIEITINPKEIGLEWTDGEFTYNGQAQKPNVTATGVEEGDECLVTVIGEKTNAGDYTAVASVLSNPNYKLPSANTKAFSIKKAPLTVTADNKTKTYGDADPELTYTVEDLVGADTKETALTGALTRDSGTDVKDGGYNITQGTLAAANYEITFNRGTLTIEPKDISKAVITLAKYAIPYTGEETSVTITDTKLDGVKLFDGTDFDVKDISNKSTDMGKKTLVIEGKGNYTGTASVKWQILEAHSVGVKVHENTKDGNPMDADSVELYKDGKLYAVLLKTITGTYSTEGIPNGDYSVVVKKNDKTITSLLTVNGRDSIVDVAIPNGNLNSIVDAKIPEPGAIDTAGAAVGGLDDVAAANVGESTSQTVEIKLTVQGKTDLTEADENSLSDQQITEKNAQVAAKSEAQKTTGSDTIVDFVDMDITKRVNDGVPTNIRDTGDNVLEIVLPYETAGKYQIGIYRYHSADGTANEDKITVETFKKLSTRPASNFSDGTFYIGDGFIVVFATKFSTYAIGYTTTAPVYNGGGVTTAYPVNVKEAEHGSTSADKFSATAGEKITVTATPDDGYVLRAVTVVGSNGEFIATTKNADGTVSFRMPASEVSVKAKFLATPEKSGVADMLITDDHILYIHGYPEGIVAPNDNISRAEVALIFYRLLKNKNVAITASFSDVPENAWYAQAVNTLASLGIINGIGDSKFDPARKITRAEFTAIATRFANSNNGTHRFDDVAVGYWAERNIATAYDYGWIEGTGENLFAPTANITRAETCAIVNRMLGRAADEAYVTANRDKLAQFPDLQDAAKWYYLDMVEAANEHDFTKTNGVETWTK